MREKNKQVGSFSMSKWYYEPVAGPSSSLTANFAASYDPAVPAPNPFPRMQLSPVVRSMTESATLLMARRARELRAQGKDIIDLSLGEPDQDPPAFAIEAAKQAITENKWNKYPPVMGYMDVRAAIAHKFKRDNGLDYAPEQVMVSTGPSRAS